ncbi:MAG: hypothetical protein WC412_07615 [Candidatus Omnitrophota bacterium]|jgi:hypothetical protein
MIPEKRHSIVEFPPSRKMAIRLAVDVFLESGRESLRDWMLQAIRDEMTAANTTHIDCGSFEVFLVTDDRTDEPEGIILFDTNTLVLGENCPGCGRNYFDTKILTIYKGWRHERHVYGCIGCGEVFSITWEREGLLCTGDLLS